MVDFAKTQNNPDGEVRNFASFPRRQDVNEVGFRRPLKIDGLNPNRLGNVVESLEPFFDDQYNMQQNNCLHFAQQLVSALCSEVYQGVPEERAYPEHFRQINRFLVRRDHGRSVFL